MAPRGRARKRDKRMDAAIETMKTEYGISDAKLVQQIAKELLNEYGGGDDAWYFIEQYTYLELLEAIVRYREANPQENDGQVDSAGGGDQSVECGTAEHHATRDAAGPSSVVAEPGLLEVVEKGLEKDTKDDTNHIPSTEWDGKGWKDIGLDQSSSKRDIEETSGSNYLDTSTIQSPALLVPTTPLSGSYPTADSTQSRRRRPCYGWIESDEEDPDEIIELEPLRQVTATTTESGCGRRSRWDLRPDDP